LSRLQIDLDPVTIGEFPQDPAELVDRIVRSGKMNAAAEADPVHPSEEPAEPFLRLCQQLLEKAEISVLAIIVDHEAVDLIDDRSNPVGIPLAEAAEWPGRVSQIELRGTDPGIDAQAARHGCRLVAEPL